MRDSSIYEGVPASAELVAELHGELRKVAARAMGRQRGSHTLQPTALVSELWLRLSRQRRAGWGTPEEFLAIASGIMRRILVDHARRKGAAKRGGDRIRVTLTANVWDGDQDRELDLLALDQALGKLDAVDQRAGRVVELRFFGGLTSEQAASCLGVSVSTVKRDWAFARAWLYRALVAGDGRD